MRMEPRTVIGMAVFILAAIASAIGQAWDRGGPADGQEPWTPGATTARPAAEPWPNEPPGYTLLFEDDFESCENSRWWEGWDDQTFVEPVSDSRLGERCAVRHVYTVGQEGGYGNEIRFGLNGRGLREIYVAYWIKLDPEWEGHESNVNKTAYIETRFPAVTPGGSDRGFMWLEAYGAGRSPLHTAVVPQMHPTECQTALWQDRPNIKWQRGQWHLLEAVMKLASSRQTNDGSLTVWLDGWPVIQKNSVCTSGADQSEIAGLVLSGMWGGRFGALRNPNQGMWYDRVRISGR